MDYWQCKIIPKNELKRWRSVDLNRVWKLLGLLWRCMAEICCKLLVALQLVFRYTLHLLPWALLLAFVKYLRGFSNCFALTARASLCFCWQQSFALVINHDEERNRRAIGVLRRGDRGALKPWLYFAMPPHQDKRAFSMENFLTLKIVWWKSFYHRVRIGCQQGSYWFFAFIFLPVSCVVCNYACIVSPIIRCNALKLNILLSIPFVRQKRCPGCLYWIQNNSYGGFNHTLGLKKK